jgi:hypothetical protein
VLRVDSLIIKPGATPPPIVDRGGCWGWRMPNGLGGPRGFRITHQTRGLSRYRAYISALRIAAPDRSDCIRVIYCRLTFGWRSIIWIAADSAMREQGLIQRCTLPQRERPEPAWVLVGIPSTEQQVRRLVRPVRSAMDESVLVLVVRLYTVEG